MSGLVASAHVQSLAAILNSQTNIDQSGVHELFGVRVHQKANKFDFQNLELIVWIRQL